MPDKPPKRRLNKRQQAKVARWLNDAHNMACDKSRTTRQTWEQLEARKQTAEDALIAAVLDWDATKGCSFKTYLWRKIQWAILDAHKRSKQRKNQQITFTDLESDDES